MTPEQLAQRLVDAGPEAAGMALGKMCAYLAAETLLLMDTPMAAKVLCMARPEAAASVMSLRIPLAQTHRPSPFSFPGECIPLPA